MGRRHRCIGSGPQTTNSAIRRPSLPDSTKYPTWKAAIKQHGNQKHSFNESFLDHSGGDLVLCFGKAVEVSVERTPKHAGYVTPLRDGNHRFFDSEFTIVVIFRR